MWRTLLLFGAILIGGGWTHGTSCVATGAYTSVKTGNWNDPTVWNAAGYPHCAGDTATIAQGNNVTIPSGVRIVSGITVNAGADSVHLSTVTVNGALVLSATMTLAANASIAMGPGGELDLAGHNITTAGYTEYNFAGNAGSRFLVHSTGGQGQFQQSGVYVVKSAMSYGDFIGLGPMVLGRNATHSYQNLSFTNCNVIWLEVAASSANTGILVSAVDFRDPNTSGGTIYEPGIDYGVTALGSNPRTLQNITWSRSSPTTGNTGAMLIRGPGITVSNSVIADWQTTFLTADNTFTNVYQSMHTGAVFALANSVPQVQADSYFYFGGAIGGAHPFSPSGTAALTVTGGVYEDTTIVGLKWFLGGAGNSATWTLHNNLFLGMGSALDFAADTASPTMTPTILFYNNTYYGDQQNSYEGTASATLLRVDHPFGILQGSQVEFYNNLTTKPNVATAQNQAISLQNNNADQVTYLGYNTDFGETSTVYSQPVIYSTGCPSGCPTPYDPSITVTDDQTAHDFSANPQFADRSRNVAAWDASLGGPGTEAHALEQMLQMNGYGGPANPNYTQAALLAYVRAGFVPGNAAFKGTGRGGADIGAMPVP